METVDAILTSGDRNKPNTFETWIQSRVLQRPIFWWIVSIVGVAVGLIGFGLSSNLKHLLGDPKPWKNVGYTLFCVTVFVLVIVLHQLKGSKKVLPFRRQFKACGVFLALLVIIIYTFFSRRGEEQEQQWKGHNDTPNNIQVAGIVSLVGFAVMAFALSIQTNYGFIGELMKFFLEELVVELTKIRWWFGFFGALFSFLLIILRSCKEKHAEGDVHQDPINNNTTPLQDIRTDSLSTVRPTQDLFTLALQNLNEKDLELSQNLRRHLIGYINYWSDQIPEGIMQDQNFIKDRIMREVETLHLIVNQMTSRDNFEMDNWLPTMYFRSRKQFLRKCESELKPDNSTAQVSRIKNWIKYCNIVLKILIPNERILCQQVFGEFSPISSKCFEQLCLQVKQDLLSFIQGIPELMSPEIVLVFRIVRDLIVPEFRSLFTRNLDMTIEMFDLTKKLGEATRDYYFRDDDVPPEIENSHSCEPHPITIQVLNRLDIAFKDRDIIEPLLKTYPNSKVQVREEWSLISHYIDWNINKLEASLESTLKKTYIYELQGVSIMANVNYILKKAYEFGFELTKKDGWLKEQASKIQQCFEQYYRENPTELLAFFKQHNVRVTEHSMREMLRLFNFNHLLEKQSYSYQGELILLVNKGFVPNCENFLHRFRTLLNGNEDTHQTYIPTIEDEIEDDVAWR
ncbi:uncharacterized protein [Arachis hypogaea]|uniref:uncharacterized protein n=1 Tax=Arachis hypogaea TaxID=3818 RepID=UPI000DEC2617|nr:exocyst complex component EXO70B1-like [Arachis hypogaea]